MEWGSILARHLSDSGVISKYIKNSKGCTQKCQTIQDINRLTKLTGFKKISNKHGELLNILSLRGMLVKTTMRFHLTSVRVAIIEGKKNQLGLEDWRADSSVKRVDCSCRRPEQ